MGKCLGSLDVATTGSVQTMVASPYLSPTTAKIESVLGEFGKTDYNATVTPFHSGSIIDYIPHDGVTPNSKKPNKLIKPYQWLGGGG
jgi:hypothetical protein